MRRIVSFFILMLFLFVVPSICYAVNYLWDKGAGTTAWTDGANWSPDAASGGPTSSDNVILDYNTGSNLIATSASVTVNNITIGGATNNGGTLNLGGALVAANITITVNGTILGKSNAISCSGNWNSTNGLFSHSGTLTFTGATKNLTSGSSSFNHITINKNLVGSNLDVKDNLDINGNLTITTGTLDLADSNVNLNLAGDFSIGSNGGVTKGTGTFTFDGTSQSMSDSTAAVQNVGDVAISSGTVTLGSDVKTDDLTINANAALDNDSTSTYNIQVNGNWSNSGTFIHHNGGSVNFLTAATQSITSNGKSFWNLLVNNTTDGAVITLQDALDVNGALTLTDGDLDSNDQNITLTALTINTNGTFTKGTGTLTFDGTTSRIWTDNSTSGQNMGNVTIGDGTDAKTVTLGSAVTADGLTISSSGSFDVSSGDNYGLTIGGNWSNSGAFLARSGTVTFNKSSGTQTLDSGGTATANQFYSLTHSGAGTLQLTNNETIATADFNNSSGTFDCNAQNLTVIGNFTLASGTTFTKGGTLSFIGTTTPITLTDNNSTKQNLGNIQIGGGSAAKTINLGSNISTDNITITALATFDVSSSNYAITCAGNWANNSGTFNEQQGTVTFSGTSKTIAAETFYGLTITGTVSLSGTISCTNFSNTGTFTIGSSYSVTPSSSGSYSNSGTITETGKIVRPAASAYITDSSGTETATVTAASGVYVTVTDLDGNLDGSSQDTITGTTVTTSVDSEAITLTETGNATGVFRNTSALAYAEYDGSASANDATLEGNNSSTITVTFTDSKDSTDNAATDTSTGQAFTTGFTVSASTPQVAGSNFTLTVTATKSGGSTSTSYTGTVNLTVNYISPSTGTQTLSTTSTSSFTNGVASISLNYPDAGTITIKATDSSDSSLTGTSGNIVFVPYNFSVSADSSTKIVNKTFTLTITAKNAAGNATTNYKGTATLSASTAACSTTGTFSPSTSLTSSYWSSGVATLTTAKFNKYGSVTFTVKDNTVTTRTGTSSSITFYPKDFSLSISDPPASRTFYYKDETFDLTVTARDYDSSTISNYNGTVNISKSGISGLSSTYTLTCSDTGSHAFSGVYGDSETTTANVTVKDSGYTSASGTLSADITVKEVTIKVSDKSGPVGTNSMVVAIYDSEDNIITEDDSTTFTVSLSEALENNSATSETTSTAKTFTDGQATIYITDNEAEVITVTPKVDSPSSASFIYTSGKLTIGTLTGAGVGIEMWREIK